MPSTTYIPQDGERVRLGRNTTFSDLFLDISDTALHVAIPSGYNFAFDIDTVEEVTWTATAFIFNESGNDRDFRVEGDNNINMILSDAGTDSLGFGTAVNAGAFISIEPGAQARDLVTSIGMAIHVEADTWDINAAGNSETVAVGGDIFIGAPTWTSVGTGFTVTDAASLYIGGPPVASTNVTLTRTRGITVGSGGVQLGVPGTATGTMYFAGATSGVVTFGAQGTAGTWTAALPAADGTCGQQLTTNGAGVWSWAAASLSEYKDDLGLLDSALALATVVGTPVHNFRYNPDKLPLGQWGCYNHEMTGIFAEEAPWAMQGRDRQAFSPINAFGMLTAAVQALAEKIDRLEGAFPTR